MARELHVVSTSILESRDEGGVINDVRDLNFAAYRAILITPIILANAPAPLRADIDHWDTICSR